MKTRLLLAFLASVTIALLWIKYPGIDLIGMIAFPGIVFSVLIGGFIGGNLTVFATWVVAGGNLVFYFVVFCIACGFWDYFRNPYK